MINLERHIRENDETGIDQVEYQPNLHRLDGGSGWQTSRHIKIDRGQHHHTGSIRARLGREHRTKVHAYMLIV